MYISVKKEDKEPAYLVCVCVRVVVGLPSPLLYAALLLVFLLLFFMLRCRWSSFSSFLCCVVVGLPVVNKKGNKNRKKKRKKKQKISCVCRSKSHGDLPPLVLLLLLLVNYTTNAPSRTHEEPASFLPYPRRARFLR